MVNFEPFVCTIIKVKSKMNKENDFFTIKSRLSGHVGVLEMLLPMLLAYVSLAIILFVA